MKKLVNSFLLAFVSFLIFLCAPLLVFLFDCSSFSYMVTVGSCITLVIVVLYFLLTIRFIPNFVVFNSSLKNSSLLGFFIFLAVSTVAFLWESFTHDTSYIDFIKTLGFQNSYIEDASLVVSIVFFAPLCEELVFRGLMYTFLKRGFTAFLSPKKAAIIAALISSVAFMLSHVDNERNSQLAILFVVGLLLVLVYEYSKSLIAPIFAHSLNNALALFDSLNGAKIFLSENLYGLLVLLPLISLFTATLLEKILTCKAVQA